MEINDIQKTKKYFRTFKFSIIKKYNDQIDSVLIMFLSKYRFQAMIHLVYPILS